MWPKFWVLSLKFLKYPRKPNPNPNPETSRKTPILGILISSAAFINILLCVFCYISPQTHRISSFLQQKLGVFFKNHPETSARTLYLDSFISVHINSNTDVFIDGYIRLYNSQRCTKMGVLSLKFLKHARDLYIYFLFLLYHPPNMWIFLFL